MHVLQLVKVCLLNYLMYSWVACKVESIVQTTIQKPKDIQFIIIEDQENRIKFTFKKFILTKIVSGKV